MTAAFFVLMVFGISIFPLIIPFILVGYMAVDGIASRQFINNLNITVADFSIYLLDLLYAAAAFLAVLGLFRALSTGRINRYTPLTKTIILLVVCYLVFFIGKFFNGYIDGAPLDSLVRRFASDTQCVYLFLPLFYLKDEKTLKTLLFYVVVVTLIFPLVQPFLYGSVDQVALQKGQKGTLRLGSNYGNILLMMGALAFFVWEKKLWLSALPLAGIVMLAQRSAFISITLCIMVLAFQKKKSLKFIMLTGGASILLIAALVVIQTTSSVPVLDKAMDRFSQTFEKTGSTESRMLVIPVALREIGSRPLVGYSYRDIYDLTLKQSVDAFSFNMLRPHNFILSSLLRTGIIGSFLLFGIVLLVMKAALRLTRKKNTKEQGMYLFSTILFFVVFGVMNTSFFSSGYVFWMLAGICLWYVNEPCDLKSQSNIQEFEEIKKENNPRILSLKKTL